MLLKTSTCTKDFFWKRKIKVKSDHKYFKFLANYLLSFSVDHFTALLKQLDHLSLLLINQGMFQVRHVAVADFSLLRELQKRLLILGVKQAIWMELLFLRNSHDLVVKRPVPPYHLNVFCNKLVKDVELLVKGKHSELRGHLVDILPFLAGVWLFLSFSIN